MLLDSFQDQTLGRGKYNFTQANEAVLAGSCKGSPSTNPQTHAERCLNFKNGKDFVEKTLSNQTL